MKRINGREVYPLYSAEDCGDVCNDGKYLKMIIITKWRDMTEFSKEDGHKCFYFYPQVSIIDSLMEDENWCGYVYENFKEHKVFDLQKTMLEILLDSGYPKEDVFHHESDLYIYVTPLTTKIVEEWCGLRRYNVNWHCPKFKDQITGKMMYDCAFQYYEMCIS